MFRVERILCFCILVVGAAAVLHASQWNKVSRLSVDETIAVPGAFLNPGEYVVKVAESAATRHIVRIMNGDQTEVVATVLAVPNRRMQPTGDTEFAFYETPVGEPAALRTWFYPGDNFGQEFVYPESQAKRIATRTKRNVLSMEDRFEPLMRLRAASRDSQPPTEFESARVYAWGSQGPRDDLESTFTENQSLDKQEASNVNRKPRAHFQKEGVRSRSDDRASSRISREVRHELIMLPNYGVFDHLAYRLNDATVTLLGQVTRPTLKSAAENVMKEIEGVEQVRNEIEVLPASPNDDRIRMEAYRAIYGHTTLNRYALQAVPPIHIIVKNGNLTLEGVVAYEVDRRVAGMRARSVKGVFSVTNNLLLPHQ